MHGLEAKARHEILNMGTITVEHLWYTSRKVPGITH